MIIKGSGVAWCGNNDGDGENREKEDMMIAVGSLSFSLSSVKERKKKVVCALLSFSLSL